MVLSKQTHRRPGLHAPAYVVARLKRFHPQVSLAWDVGHECWALVAHDNFGAHVVVHRLLSPMRPPEGKTKRIPKRTAEVPSLANTVWWLDKHDSRRWENASMQRQWLEEVDSQGPHEETKRAEERASCRIEEGADRMWRLAGKRVPFGNLRPTGDHPTDSPVPGRSGPAADG